LDCGKSVTGKGSHEFVFIISINKTERIMLKKLSKKQEEFFFDAYKSSLMALAMPEGPNRR
jgi:hypothetical protein